MKLAKQITEKIIEEFGLPTVLIRTNKAKELTLLSSKFGGLPYWDMEMPYPTDSQGHKLTLLAQFNLEDIKDVDVLPQSGILQFFLYCNSEFEYGSNYDDYIDNDCFRVVYHSKVDTGITEEDVKSLNIPTSLDEVNDYDAIWGTVGIDFVLSKTVSPDTELFKEKFIESAAELGWHIDDPDDDILDFLVDGDIMEEVYDICYKDNNRVLGCPVFAQADPREESAKYERYDTLLFQMESADDVDTDFTAEWGDTGIAHFFINRDDLLRQNFENIIYSWDCY